MVKKPQEKLQSRTYTGEEREYIFPQKWNQIKIEQIRAGNLHRPETKKKNSKMNA